MAPPDVCGKTLLLVEQSGPREGGGDRRVRGTGRTPQGCRVWELRGRVQTALEHLTLGMGEGRIWGRGLVSSGLDRVCEEFGGPLTRWTLSPWAEARSGAGRAEWGCGWLKTEEEVKGQGVRRHKTRSGPREERPGAQRKDEERSAGKEERLQGRKGRGCRRSPQDHRG